MKDKTCDERIDAELKRELEALKEIQNDFDELDSHGLSFDHVEAGTFEDQDEPYFRWQISWGGPSDEFRFFVQNGDELERVEYWFLDWFDGACRKIDEEVINDIWESYLLPYAQDMMAPPTEPTPFWKFQ